MKRTFVPRHARSGSHASEEDEGTSENRLLAPASWWGSGARPQPIIDLDDLPTGHPLSTVLTSMSRPQPGAARPLHIALVGEGTYPFGPGGVSLWCHQLIEGMPEHSFTAVALTVDGSERAAWDRPTNLTQVINLPLWGFASGRTPRRSGPWPAFVEAHRAFLHALVRPVPQSPVAVDSPSEFELALRTMIETARGGDVSRELATDGSVQRLIEAWREFAPDGRQRPLTVREAVATTARLEHMLRPLSHPPIEADIVHLSMNGISGLVGLHSKWALGTPVVLSEHGVYLRERYLGLATDDAGHKVKVLTARFHRAMSSAVYRTADVLAPHSSFNRRWQRYGGGQTDRMETMYNGIDPADFPAAQGEPDEPTIVYVGRVDPLKDLHTLIRAFAIVRASLPDARLRMFGPVTRENEEYFGTCQALVVQLGLTGAATFEGRVARTVDAYRAGHVVALTSVSEGFPFTVVESMSVGRPQVATDVGGVAEAVGDAGLVVPARDPHAVAEACLRLLGDADLRREMAERARRRVLDQFTLRQWTDAYRDIYSALAQSARPRHATRPGSVVDLTRAEEGAASGSSASQASQASQASEASA